jgi:serine/threonine protein kinase
MYDAFFNKTKQTMYLVMDLVQGKSLKQYLEQDKFSEELAKIIFR